LCLRVCGNSDEDTRASGLEEFETFHVSILAIEQESFYAGLPFLRPASNGRQFSQPFYDVVDPF
jgi:hypothetical protein